MTKEEVFEALDNAIYRIPEHFNGSEVDYLLEHQLLDLPFSWSIDSGISKAVILIKDAPFVVKIPFYCLYNEGAYQDAINDWENDRDYEFLKWEKEHPNYTDEEREEWLNTYEENYPLPDEESVAWYEDISGASSIDILDTDIPEISDWNYCQLESTIYQLAVREGLGAYFAEEGLLGIIDNTPIYYQTRCTPMDSVSIDYNSKEVKDKRSFSIDTCEKFKIYCFDEIWIADFIKAYGLDEFKRLDAFLDKYGIDDLRQCNIGYLDGAPILFDYSGYRGW